MVRERENTEKERTVKKIEISGKKKGRGSGGESEEGKNGRKD